MAEVLPRQVGDGFAPRRRDVPVNDGNLLECARLRTIARPGGCCGRIPLALPPGAATAPKHTGDRITGEYVLTIWALLPGTDRR